MLLVLCILVIGAVGTCFVLHCRRTSVVDGLFSIFWFASFAWLLSYPVRGILIDYDLVDLQVPQLLSEAELAVALAYALVIWLAMYTGYATCAPRVSTRSRWLSVQISPYRITLLLIVSIVVAIAFIVGNLYVGGTLETFGDTQIERRRGQGHLFIWAEFFFLVSIVFFSSVLPKRRWSLGDRGLALLVLAASAFVGIALATRRLLAGVILSIVLIQFRTKRLKWRHVLGAVLVFLLLIPILQAYRYIPFMEYTENPAVILDSMDLLLSNWRLPLSTISSSFEGVDHVATLFRRADPMQLATGVDWGQAWIFNIGLSMFPRLVWEGKPEVYGSLAIQEFLFPDLFFGGAAVSTFPSGLVVDYAFGFGIFVAPVLAALTGRVLRIVESHLSETGHPILRALAFFCYIFAFNLIRGGSAFLQGVVLFIVVCVLVAGWRSTAEAVRAVWVDLVGAGPSPVITVLK